jgi:cytochrome c oxidase subunit 1
VIYTTWLIVLGAAVAIAALFGWALEPADAEDSDFDPPAAGEQSSKELVNV